MPESPLEAVTAPPKQGVAGRVVPGTAPRRRLRPHVDYELIGCGLHGHVLVGTDAGEIRPEDAEFVRPLNGSRLYRCLRCDAWIELPPPVAPTRPYLPAREDVTFPLRGRRLRDRYVLRLIVVDRVLHVAVLGAIAFAVFAFARHRDVLHGDYTKVLAALQGALGGPSGESHSWIVRNLNRLFTLSSTELYFIGVVLLVYIAILVAEAIGLWIARRWAEYLTVLETGSLIPFEIYELSGSVSALKILTLVINVAVVAYLVLVHRLFGLRGGRVASEARYGDS